MSMVMVQEVAWWTEMPLTRLFRILAYKTPPGQPQPVWFRSTPKKVTDKYAAVQSSMLSDYMHACLTIKKSLTEA